MHHDRLARRTPRSAAMAIATGLLLVATACRDHGEAATDPADTDGDEPTDGPPSSPPLLPRPDTQTCRFDGWAPGLLPPVQLEPVDVDPIDDASTMTVDAQTGIVFVGARDGRVLAYEADGAQALTTVRAADGVPVTGLAVSADPDGDHLFVRTEPTGPTRTLVLRYRLEDPRTIDPASALEVIEIPHDPEGRTGSGLFAHAGRLWLGVGDGIEGPGDPLGPALDPTRRPGNLLRLDVSTLAMPFDYALPPDNPFADATGAGPETWSYGLRDPVGCSVDVTRDRVWCGDAGANVSEADVARKGVDLGWPRLEGADCQLPSGCEHLDTMGPRALQRHDADDCGVTAAAVADGMDPDLDGALVWSDGCSGRLFAVRVDEDDRPLSHSIIGQHGPALVAMTADPFAGGLWAVDGDGTLGRLVVRRPPGTFPTLLSDSRCLHDPQGLAPAPDMVPYTLNAPLWTDAAEKRRHIVLPPGTTIDANDDGTLVFPEGTVLLKTFAYATDPEDPTQTTPVETRVMIRRAYAWEFHSYAWDADGQDATLLDADERRDLGAVIDGTLRPVEHLFPSRAQCGYCHGSGKTRALGPRLDQLALEVDYDGTVRPQLEALASIGMFTDALPSPAPMTDYRDPAASDEDRARAYLHANCGHCHRPHGWVPPDLDLDLRWTTTTADTNLCGVPPQYSSPVPGEYRVAPGDPEDSLVWRRIEIRGLWQMPPIATSVVDPQAEVVRTWIEGLPGCP